MCKHGTETLVWVTICEEDSHTGKEYMKQVGIDSCIADLVSAMQIAGIRTRGSCCGHGITDGTILLQDGRTLIIRKYQ